MSNALAISIIGYVGVFAFAFLIYLAYSTKGNTQVVSILGLVGLIALIMFRNAKRFEFYGLKIEK